LPWKSRRLKGPNVRAFCWGLAKKRHHVNAETISFGDASIYAGYTLTFSSMRACGRLISAYIGSRDCD
jgi:hypothetical protein